MQQVDLGDLLAHWQHRVQAGHGVLEDHAYLRAAQLFHLLLSGGEDVGVAQADAAAGDHPRGIGNQPQDREGGGSFAGTGFTHKAQGFAALQLKVHVVDRLHNAVVGAELHT